MIIILLTALAQTALGQSPELLELSRIQNEDTLERARSELRACEQANTCDATRRLSILTGYLLLKAGDVSESLTQLRKYPAPEGLEMLRDYYIGEALFSLREYSEAERQFEKIAAQSELPWLASKAQDRSCQAIFMQGRWSDAATVLKRFLKKRASPETLYMLAHSLEKSRNSAQALRYYRQIAVSYPLHPLAKWAHATHRFKFTVEELMLRSKRLMEGVHPAEAALEARAAMEMSATASRPQLRLLLSQALISSGQNSEALEVLSSMHQDEPLWASQALLLQSKEAMRQNDDIAANRLLSQIESSFPLTAAAPESRFLRGFIALHREQFDTCSELLTDMPTIYPSWQRLDEAMWYEALCQLRSNQFQATQVILRKLLKRFPRSSVATQAAYWLIRAQELGGSLTKQELVSAFDSFRRKHFGTIYARWATIHLQQMGEKPASLVAFQTKLNPREPPEVLKTAMNIASSGLFEDALNEVAASAPKSTQSDEILAAGPFLHYLGAHSLAIKLALRIPTGKATRADARLLSFPPAFQTTVERSATDFAIAPSFIWAIMKRESGFAPKAQSPVGARGLMQLMPKTAVAAAEELHFQLNSSEMLFEPSVNIRLATWYLAALQRRFQNIALASAAYNAGPLAASKWVTQYGHLPLDLFIECIPYRETRHYVKQVLADEYIYRLLYGGGDESLQTFIIPQPDPDGVSF